MCLAGGEAAGGKIRESWAWLGRDLRPSGMGKDEAVLRLEPKIAHLLHFMWE